MNILIAILFIFGFLIGSIPTGYVIGRIKGIDLRKHGSGNIGATNAKRVMGNKAGLFTLLGDVLKGLFAVYLPYLIAKDFSYLVPFSGLGAILGHCFSPFLQFKGGKGIATSLGVFIFLAPIQTLFAVVIFCIVYKLSSYVSLSALVATASLLLTLLYHFRSNLNTPIIYTITITAVTVLVKHRSNISRLLAGNELKA